MRIVTNRPANCRGSGGIHGSGAVQCGAKEDAIIELTLEQRQELNAPEPGAIDPETKERYVLIRQEAYQRHKSLLAMDDYDLDEGAAYINEIMAEDDAHDPLLESYQRYRREA